MDLKQAAEQIHNHPQLIQQIAQSADGQRLMSMLNQNGNDLQKAAQKAEQGDMMAMVGLLKQVMANSDGRALLERMAKELQ